MERMHSFNYNKVVWEFLANNWRSESNPQINFCHALNLKCRTFNYFCLSNNPTYITLSVPLPTSPPHLPRLQWNAFSINLLARRLGTPPFVCLCLLAPRMVLDPWQLKLLAKSFTHTQQEMAKVFLVTPTNRNDAFHLPLYWPGRNGKVFRKRRCASGSLPSQRRRIWVTYLLAAKFSAYDWPFVNGRWRCKSICCTDFRCISTVSFVLFLGAKFLKAFQVLSYASSGRVVLIEFQMAKVAPGSLHSSTSTTCTYPTFCSWPHRCGPHRMPDPCPPYSCQWWIPSSGLRARSPQIQAPHDAPNPLQRQWHYFY